LFERHHATLFKFFCRMTGDPAAAEDLVQVFFRMLKYRRTYRDHCRIDELDAAILTVRVDRALKELREIFSRLSNEKTSWNAKKSEITLRTI
jgi:DNA-directed RNA polymerase specialized sigma24 family protein